MGISVSSWAPHSPDGDTPLSRIAPSRYASAFGGGPVRPPGTTLRLVASETPSRRDQVRVRATWPGLRAGCPAPLPFWCEPTPRGLESGQSSEQEINNALRLRSARARPRGRYCGDYPEVQSPEGQRSEANGDTATRKPTSPSLRLGDTCSARHTGRPWNDVEGPPPAPGAHRKARPSALAHHWPCTDTGIQIR